MPSAPTAKVPALCQRVPTGWRLRIPPAARRAARRSERAPRKCAAEVVPRPHAAYSRRGSSKTTSTAPTPPATVSHHARVGASGAWLTATKRTSGRAPALAQRPERGLRERTSDVTHERDHSRTARGGERARRRRIPYPRNRRRRRRGAGRQESAWVHRRSRVPSPRGVGSAVTARRPSRPVPRPSLARRATATNRRRAESPSFRPELRCSHDTAPA
jgi:hypothetical protein